MLVLSRKVGERIHVGDEIVLEIRRIAGNRVTLALDAPRSVRILRGELEHAARAFHPTTTEQPPAATGLPIAGRMVVLNQLPIQPVSRECLT